MKRDYTGIPATLKRSSAPLHNPGIPHRFNQIIFIHAQFKAAEDYVGAVAIQHFNHLVGALFLDFLHHGKHVTSHSFVGRDAAQCREDQCPHPFHRLRTDMSCAALHFSGIHGRRQRAILPKPLWRARMRGLELWAWVLSLIKHLPSN